MNHSRSKTGVIRGIHAEKWDKLVYPINGKMVAVIVDLREESETFEKIETFDFDCTNGPIKALFLPNGMGNSICIIEGPVDYTYLVSAYWTPDSSFAINPFDKDLNIKWPVSNPILTDKDMTAPGMRDRFPDIYK
ncbi:MAG: dTDP-4-dehydrorhamnose 3,5-epimerase family protein [Patescibacteria group bacterium]